jgi:hypothetical protein
MRITRIKLNRLRNEEWYNYFTEFKTFVEQTTPEVLDIEALFVVFMTFYGKADETLEQIRKSNYTSEIVQLDALRDNTWTGLSETVKSALHHYNESKRAAAKRLAILFDHYGNIAVKTYNEETASIYNFLQDIRGKYAAEIVTLDLTGWLNELERANNEFETAVLERNREYAGKTDLSMLEIRRQTGRAYLDIVERIEALCLIYGDDRFAPFIKILNANIERYKTAINRRGGSKNSQDDSESKVVTE